MVWTRGLGRALGTVSCRGLGKGDHDNSDDAPQRRRPTASAHRQRVPMTFADEVDIPVTETDVPVVEVDVPEDDADTIAQAAEDEPEGFPGGPGDPSMLTEYADHVAGSVWMGEERPELKLSSHRRKVHSLGRHVPAIERLVTGTGLSPLIMLVELLMVTAEATRAETGQYRGPTSQQLGGYITTLQCWIYEHFPSVMESTADPDYNEDSPRACRWIATKKTVKSIRTPTYRERLDRLQIPDVCWIPYGEHRSVRDFHMISCYSGLLPWGPVVVYYRPERVMWQFRYTQTIPVPPVDSWVSFDDIYDRFTENS
ncbi:uncharacterized protein LOC114371770 [Glycine soja]|uniref:uncharacterized protein LOC114371770 n=1 Tax=Glycine soja TaxID=3848 RepID=UPI00103B5285|nr:uncharacterized protein LOC114371770 [Glycine soja]